MNYLEENVLMQYYGPLEPDTISIFVNSIGKYHSIKKTIRSRLIRVFIELIQNALYYSKDRLLDSGVGYFIITEYENYIELSVSNKVETDKAKLIYEKCEYYNSISYIDLKKIKANILSNLDYSKDGANLGIIISKIVSKNNLEVNYIKTDDTYSIYTIKTKYSK